MRKGRYLNQIWFESTILQQNRVMKLNCWMITKVLKNCLFFGYDMTNPKYNYHYPLTCYCGQFPFGCRYGGQALFSPFYMASGLKSVSYFTSKIKSGIGARLVSRFF